MSSSKMKKSSKNTSISDFFKPLKPNPEQEVKETENEKEKTTENGQKSTAGSVDVRNLKCPKRRVLVDDIAEEIMKKKRAVRKRSNVIKDLGKSQMVLDCGQSVIGSVTCDKCGMVYSVDVAEDVKMHEKFHEDWRCRFEFSRKYLLTFLNFHRKVNGKFMVYYLGTFAEESFKKTVSDYMKKINEELGYTSNDDNLWSLDKRILLVLQCRLERLFIGGICIIEKINKAWTDVTRKEVETGIDVNDWIVGVDRIWVDPHCRRSTVAFSLLDAATTRDRQMQLRARRLRFAFSDPTDDGKKLAKRFLETHYMPEDRFDGEILVY